ncbi:MAG: hypothetical protein AAGD25_24190 [Cyanobacteria bacterium P01_F01_bin.150]
MTVPSLNPERTQTSGYYRYAYISFEDIFEIEYEPEHPIHETAGLFQSAYFYSPQGL